MVCQGVIIIHSSQELWHRSLKSSSWAMLWRWSKDPLCILIVRIGMRKIHDQSLFMHPLCILRCIKLSTQASPLIDPRACESLFDLECMELSVCPPKDDGSREITTLMMFRVHSLNKGWRKTLFLFLWSILSNQTSSHNALGWIFHQALVLYSFLVN